MMRMAGIAFIGRPKIIYAKSIAVRSAALAIDCYLEEAQPWQSG